MNTITPIYAIGSGFPSFGSLAWQIPVILLLVIVNAFFVCAEESVRRLKYSPLDDFGGKAGEVIRRIMEHTDRYLLSAQLGITMATVVLGALATRWIAAWLTPFQGDAHAFSVSPLNITMLDWEVTGLALLFAVILVSVVQVTLGEQIPKVIALRHPALMARFTCVPLYYFSLIFHPFNSVLRWIGDTLLMKVGGVKPTTVDVVSADEIRTMVENTEESDEVTETERDILMNALELSDMCARDIMTPRSEVVVLDVNATFAENFQTALKSSHTRFPLVDGHLDDIQGIVHVKDLLPFSGQDEVDLRTVMRNHVSVSEQLPLDETLKKFLGCRAHLAVVSDEFGGAAGVVTLDNVIEELVGDIQDEFDEPEIVEYRRFEDGRFEVDGRYGIHELESEFGVELEDADVSTVGGYVINYLGHLPEEGEALQLGDYSVTVAGAEGGRVQKLLFVPAPQNEKIAG